jgi:hypothetical protein
VTRFDFSAPPIDGNPRIQSWINEIDLATGSSLTEPILAKASDLGVAEGCHILKREGWYYFFTAEGGTQGGHRGEPNSDMCSELTLQNMSTEADPPWVPLTLRLRV